MTPYGSMTLTNWRGSVWGECYTSVWPPGGWATSAPPQADDWRTCCSLLAQRDHTASAAWQPLPAAFHTHPSRLPLCLQKVFVTEHLQQSSVTILRKSFRKRKWLWSSLGGGGSDSTCDTHCLKKQGTIGQGRWRNAPAGTQKQILSARLWAG